MVSLLKNGNITFFDFRANFEGQYFNIGIEALKIFSFLYALCPPPIIRIFCPEISIFMGKKFLFIVFHFMHNYIVTGFLKTGQLLHV
jgi:hypothetical protein